MTQAWGPRDHLSWLAMSSRQWRGLGYGDNGVTMEVREKRQEHWVEHGAGKVKAMKMNSEAHQWQQNWTTKRRRLDSDENTSISEHDGESFKSR